MIRGIDISKWQSPTPSLDGLAFVVVKASQGTTADPMYATHYAACRKAGVVTMAYCYGVDDAVVPVAAQAATFLDVAKDADFLWLDQEASGFSDAEAQQFIDLVRKVRPCGLYHSASGFGGVNCDAKWVADWRDASEAAGYPRTGDGSKEFPGW
ncbi:MAG: GH25 family lysozyme, partial [Planctomycetota bacterium]